MKPILLVLAAGLGSRYGGVKQIVGVGLRNETLLDFSTYDAIKSGFGKVVYIIRKDIEKDFRERLFDRVARNVDASYVFQTPEAFLNAGQQKQAAGAGRKKPWGTVHAILCAKDCLNAPFTVINADDYYGRKAYETMSRYLSITAANSKNHAMVGYVLGNTMSLSGTVSRGICQVSGGELTGLHEHTKIGYEEDGKSIYSLINGEKTKLTGKEWVSMNFFGFTLSVLPRFMAYFEEFISKNAGAEKAEALLPEAAGILVKEGYGKIKFFTSEESWFGMTYPEDREIVKVEIAKKIREGYYPESLWIKG